MHRPLATALLAMASCCAATAQQIALPSNVVEGYLHNGLHYIVKPNPQPRHTVEFRLVMHVGSLQEADGQQGCAHFLEHMAFKGMRQFPAGGMVDYFERQGMKYGRDINAFTGFDRTVYWFTVPTFYKHEATLDTTLMVVRGILADLTLDEESARNERDVIVEELRSYDTHDPFYTLKIGQGRHAARMPLGSEEDIRRIDRQQLLRFYHRWYAPQFATLIIVGDVDERLAVDRLEQCLGNLPRKGASHLRDYPLTYQRGTQLMERADSIGSGTRLELMIPHPSTFTPDIGHTVEKLRDDLLRQAVNAHLSAAGVSATATDQWYLARTGHFALSFSEGNKDSLLRDVTMVAHVLRHLAKAGCADEELHRLTEEICRKVHVDGGQKLSSVWCDDLIDYALMGDLRLYHDEEAEAVRQQLRQTTSTDIARRAKALLDDMKRHLLISHSHPQGDEHLLTATDVWKAWNNPEPRPGKETGTEETGAEETGVCRRLLTPQTPQTPDSLTPDSPTPDSLTPDSPALPEVLAGQHTGGEEAVLSHKTYADLGVHEVVLRNGVRMLFRPTMEEERRVQVVALGRGGTADLSDDHYYRLRDAAAYMDMGGIEGIESDTLMEVMGRRGISMNIGLEDQWHELMATADATDAQLLMNLMYEKMHHPRRSHDDFEESRQSELDTWGQETLLGRMMRLDPDRQLTGCVDSLVGNVPARRPMQPADLVAMDLDSMADYYRRLYTNPQELTLIVTGNYDLPVVRAIATSTFARMRQPDDALTPDDEPVQPVRTCQRQFDHDNASQSVFNYIFAGNYFPSLQTTLTFKLMRDLLQQRMLTVLREQENIVYSPYSDLYYRGLPQRTYYFWLTIAVKRENAERMKRALRDIITDLQQTPVAESELEKMKRSFIVTRRQQLSDMAPTEWRNVLEGLLKNGESLDDFDHYEEVLGRITPEEVRQAFCNYIDMDYSILMLKESLSRSGD